MKDRPLGLFDDDRRVLLPASYALSSIAFAAWIRLRRSAFSRTICP
jgi:hypothetical protein